MKALDLNHVALEGTHLIEASAGTGKTYTIASLFLRFVLEKELSVDKILVVTYTVSATDELKDRIRRRIVSALDAFASGSSNDRFIDGLIHSHADQARAKALLKDAINRFDESSVYTIHGFCQRVLQDMAFESGSLFDTELITDQKPILKEVIEDFYRRHFYEDTYPECVHYALKKGLSLGSFMRFYIKAGLSARIIPEVERPDMDQTITLYRQAFEGLSKSWTICAPDIEHILLTDTGLNRQRFRKGSIPLWTAEMDKYIRSGGRNLPLFKNFDRFCSSTIKDAVKKGMLAPTHEFFDRCDRLRHISESLCDLMDQYLAWLKHEFFLYMKTHLSEKKEKLGLVHFDDLITRTHSGVCRQGGHALASSIRERFSAAMVDEFQDTDPIQYEIFKQVFEDRPLFLIGDPKQAIYSFRGADIFTYMQASQAIEDEKRHTLKENYRSDPGLVRAVNTVFSRAQAPFVFEQIGFGPVDAAIRDECVQGDQGKRPCLYIGYVPGTPEGDLPRERLEKRIAHGVAAEILGLIGDSREGLIIDDRPVMPRDIAVLVRENRQARIVRDVLRSYDIPSVLLSEENVFDSWEAFDMEVLLKAIFEPFMEGYVRAALSGPLLGLSAGDIESLQLDETLWGRWIETFRGYRDLWQDHGFIRMFRGFLSEQGVRQRLLSSNHGERSLTNILHLSEILNQASTEMGLGMGELVKWLSIQRDPDLAGSEEYQLRLESDDDAVIIQTIHKSKGLEYGVVFCPYAWAGSGLRDKEPFLFHDADNGYEPLFDIGSEEAAVHREYAHKEVLAENVRLLYVGVTRARHRCYLAWGAFRKALDSAMTYILHPEVYRDGIMPLDEELRRDLAAMEHISDSGITVKDMPVQAAAGYTAERPGLEREMACRDLSRPIERSWRITSFTSLVSGAPYIHDSADHDASGDMFRRKDLRETDTPGHDIFGFPRGARPGVMLHRIFEVIDYRADDVQLGRQVSNVLTEYGYDISWLDVIMDMVKKVLFSRLEDFCLSDIAFEQRLNELVFYYPLRKTSPAQLKSIFMQMPGFEAGRDYPGRIGELSFEPVQGYLKGAVDLILRFEDRYYIIDWKSNHLGDTIGDYDQDSLFDTMKQSHYILQYSLYTLALDRYLRHRHASYSYEKNFGGVFYIFLRGVDPGLGNEYGIYFDRPHEALINEMDRVLIG